MGDDGKIGSAKLVAQTPVAAVRSAPAAGPQCMYVEMWLRAHPRIDAAAFQSLRALPKAQQGAVMFELHRRYGNAVIQRGLAGAFPNRDAGGSANLDEEVGLERRKKPIPAAQPKSASGGGPTEKIAADGVLGSGTDLPFLDTIQASFGHHVVTEIQAHTDRDAAEASESLGATAFATGNEVAFARTPDLHTAAHEAAHVIQQRGGVSLKGGVGEAGDAHEQHADQVADAVVAGKSAEQLLDSTVGQGAATGAVQRKEDDEKGGRTNPAFVNDNGDRLIIAIMDRIDTTPLLQPHPRLRWRSEAFAKSELGLAISHYIKAVPDMILKQMMMLSYPADLFALVDAARRGPAGSRFDAIKIVLATAFDEPLIASIRRMGTRAVVQLDLHVGQQVLGSSLVASCPLDGVIAELLVNPLLIDHQPRKKGAPDDTGGRPFAKGTRSIKYEWQGARDPNLWNWIKVTSPADATVEDVANTPFVGDYVIGGSVQAYRIAASPPYFGIPFETAQLVLQASVYAPDDVKVKLDTGPGPRIADPNMLAMSAVSDDAARAQAPPPSREDPPSAQTLDRVQLQIGFMNRQLAPWHANEPLAGAIMFVDRRYAEFAHDPKAAKQWAAALAAQERALFAASSELTEFLDDIAKTGAKPTDAPGLMPVMGVIDAYAHAGAVAHLHAEAPTALAEARRMKTMLPLALAEDRIRSARGEVVQQRKVEAGATALEPNADKTPVNINDQLQRAADLRLRAAQGEKLDPDAVEMLSIDASETALRARLVTLATQAHAVMRKADDVGLDQGRYPGGSWSVHMVADLILQKVNGPVGQEPSDENDHSGGGWHEQLDKAALWVGPRPGMTPNQTVIAQRREAIKHVSQQLGIFAQDLNIGEYLKWAYDRISDQELRNMLRDMALQIGVAILTGEVIGVAGAAVRGFTLAGEIGAELREASLLYKGAEIIGTAGLNTAVQGAMGGKVGVHEFAENALGIVLTNVALKPFQGILRDSAAVEGELQTWGRSAGRFGKAAAGLVIDTGASIGAAGVAHAVTHGGEMSQADAKEWVNMGLSIAASKFVHQRTQGMQHRIVEIKRELMTNSYDHLFEKVTALEQRSNLKEGAHPTPEQALELLIERHKLLVEERNLYEADPKAKKALVDTKADLAATGAQFAEVPLHLAHLSPVVEGHVYEGSPAEIQKAFHVADATGVPLTREWLPEQSAWRVTSGERVIEIHEHGGRGAKPHESLRAAEEVPGSGFTGMAPPHQARVKIQVAEVQARAKEAADILNSSTGRRVFTAEADGSVTVTVNGQQVRVKFVVGEPTPQVAKHDYAHGANEVTVTFSEQARPQDLTRAAAHELDEIAALVEQPALDRPGVLHKDSTATAATELSAHDIGRKAELQILLHELHTQPTRQVELMQEVKALVEHLGFDVNTIDADPRARRLLGDANVEGIVHGRMSSGKTPPSSAIALEVVTTTSSVKPGTGGKTSAMYEAGAGKQYVENELATELFGPGGFEVTRLFGPLKKTRGYESTVDLVRLEQQKQARKAAGGTYKPVPEYRAEVYGIDPTTGRKTEQPVEVHAIEITTVTDFMDTSEAGGKHKITQFVFTLDTLSRKYPTSRLTYTIVAPGEPTPATRRFINETVNNAGLANRVRVVWRIVPIT